MVQVPSVDRIDLGALGIVVALLVVAYGIYPRRLVQVSAWFAIVILFICWTGYFVHKVVFDEVVFWE